MTRKTEKDICLAMQRIVKYIQASGFRPARDCYVHSYPLLVAEASGVTQRGQWTGSMIVEFIQRLFDSPWMRRAFKCDIDSDVAEKLAHALNNRATSEELEKLAESLVNNSLVGGSKFLHFCDPARFPITDRFLRMVTGTPWHVTMQADYYRDYRLAVAAVDDEHALLAMAWAAEVFGYTVTRVRAIEALVFYYAKAMSRGLIGRVAA
jgi:hypothetical protein